MNYVVGRRYNKEEYCFAGKNFLHSTFVSLSIFNPAVPA